MKKIILFFIILIGIFFNLSVGAVFNMTVSPVKYEIEAAPWDIVVRSAQIYNYSDEDLYITTSKAEFVSDGNTWQPRIVPAASSTSIANWITLHTQDFTIAPNSQKTINFDIIIPDNATPGWHYWAVFFEHDARDLWTSTSKVWVNVDYWVLLLINVEWEVIKDGEFDDVRVSWWGNVSFSWPSKKNKDSCPLWDFSRSNFDGKCVDTPKKEKEESIDLSDIWNLLPDEDDNLNVTFEIPFENKWNTHIKPIGKIVLKDEDGRQIKSIGKESILNDNGAIIWEKIVDHIPINDVGWNVLPQTKRNFQWEWKWFPYETFDEDGNRIIEYATPSEYYTKKNIPENTVLSFWERVLERKNQKKVTAEIEFAYEDLNWELIEYTSAKEFTIEYVDTYIGPNKYILVWSAVVLGILGFFYIFWLLRKKKCRKCGKRIKKHLKACPYCGKKQNKKKKKD